MGGAHEPGTIEQDLYFGVQDNGVFATTDAGTGSPKWTNVFCCDSFDVTADPARVVVTQCCGFSVFVAGKGLAAPVPIATNPPGSIPTFQFPDFIARFADNQYIGVTSSGAFITTDITAKPVGWTQLGAGSTPSRRRREVDISRRKLQKRSAVRATRSHTHLEITMSRGDLRGQS
jgi:hypothetical protein